MSSRQNVPPAKVPLSVADDIDGEASETPLGSVTDEPDPLTVSAENVDVPASTAEGQQ